METGNDVKMVAERLLDQAEQVCRQRLKNDPDNRAVLRSLAEVCRKQGNLREAAAAYDKLFRLDSSDQEAGYLQALFAEKEWPTAPTGIRAAPFVLLRSFLPQEFHDSLIPFMISVQEKFDHAVLSTAQGDKKYKPEAWEALAFNGNWEFRKRMPEKLREIVPRVLPRLHIPPFKIQHIESQVHAYRDGHFLKPHVDVDAMRPKLANRVLNWVYFFHKFPRPFRGGELLLFDTDPETCNYTSARFTKVVPEDNCLIIFPSNYYHCVTLLRCPSKDFSDSRFVLNGFIHKCPEAESAVEARV